MEQCNESSQSGFDEKLVYGVGFLDPGLWAGIPVVVDLHGDHSPFEQQRVVDW